MEWESVGYDEAPKRLLDRLDALANDREKWGAGLMTMVESDDAGAVLTFVTFALVGEQPMGSIGWWDGDSFEIQWYAAKFSRSLREEAAPEEAAP